MRGVDYAFINIFPSLTLIFLYIKSKTLLTVSLNSKLFRRIILCIIFIMMADSTVWLFDGRAGSHARTVMYIANFAYFILIALIPAQFLMYISERLWEFRIQKLRVLWFLSPLVVYAVLLAITPWYGTIFVIDATNKYGRGSLVLFQQLLSISYIGAAAIISVVRYFVEEAAEKRNEARAFSAFIFMTIAGAVIQIFDYSSPFMWPLAASSVVLVYILLQHEQITLDALTGLNNRRRMDRYIDSLISRGENAFNLIIIDVNDFKAINDNYGHMSGDEALRILAKALMSFYAHTNAFISRYGGDEFCIITFETDEMVLARDLQLLKEHITETFAKNSFECGFSVSIGSARYAGGMKKSALFESADVKMYIDKRLIASEGAASKP